MSAAQFTPVELVVQLRETASSTHLTPGAGPLDPLIDNLVHGQDVARPLGRQRSMPLEPAAAALQHAWSSRFYGAQKRLRDTRLIATDWDWTGGHGSTEIRGPVADLFMLATGRTTATMSTTVERRKSVS